MALPVLDGNQTATTLSSVVTGGEHIVAHTVVSLGSTAISNITSAVSGIVVTIPSLERIANSAATDGIADTTLNFIKIGGHQSGSNQTAHIVHVSAGGAMSVDATDSVVSISNLPSTQTVAGTVTANAGGDLSGAIEIVNDVSNVSHKIAVQLYDDNGSAIGVSNNPLPISGTVTAGMLIVENAANSFPNQYPPVQLKADGQNGSLRVRMDYSFASDANSSSVIGRSDAADQSPTAFVKASVVAGSVTIGSLPAISGTVTAGMLLVENASNNFPNQYSPVQLSANPQNGSLRVRLDYNNVADAQPNSNSVIGRTDVSESGNNAYIKAKVIAGTVTIGNSVTIGSLPSGALTTRFGSVTTANTAQITSAVTNTSRKYLLAQNISAGTVTIGIGFSPTTTQGIQLTAGGGLTFDAFCPTGAVYWLGAVTGAAWTILEG